MIFWGAANSCRSTRERVRVRVWRNQRNFSDADLLEVLEPSPHRREPPCPIFGTCGGCQYQHMSYGEQLRSKRKQIADLFARVGKFENAVVEESARWRR